MIALLDGYWEGLKTLFLTALFNPAFLLFLLAIYFLGKLFGRLVSQPNVWKLILAGYLGIAFIEPIRSLGLFFGAIFLLGFFNGAIRSAPAILAWAGSLGDIFFAFRHRQAFEDIRRRERELEEELRRARAQAHRHQQGESDAQQSWRREQEQQRARKAEDTSRQEQARSGNRTQQKAHQSDRQSQNERTSSKTFTPSPPDDLRAKYLKTLGLDPCKTWSPDEIKAAYRKAAKRTHPDAGGSPVAFIAVQNAWEWLRKA